MWGKKKQLSKSLFWYEPKFRRARVWSNIELKKIAPYFRGDIINISGWADEDKIGGTYREYFVNATSYRVSNKEGGPQKGKSLYLHDSLAIDLEVPISEEHIQAYDCVFVHTVLEHVFNIFQAVENLCKMSRDVIICIVPFIQMVHTAPNYKDYWRFTPYCLEKLFAQHGFKTIYASAGPNLSETSLYYLWVVSKNPDKWVKVFGFPPKIPELPNGDVIYKTLGERMRALLQLLFSSFQKWRCK
jgi:hypothetical protein